MKDQVKTAVKCLVHRVTNALYEHPFSEIVSVPAAVRKSVTVIYEDDCQEQFEYENSGELIIEGLFLKKFRHYGVMFMMSLKGSNKFRKVKHQQILQSLRFFRQKYLMIRLKDCHDSMKHASDDRYFKFALIIGPIMEGIRRQLQATTFRTLQGKSLFRMSQFAYLQRSFKHLVLTAAKKSFSRIKQFVNISHGFQKSINNATGLINKLILADGFDKIYNNANLAKRLSEGVQKITKLQREHYLSSFLRSLKIRENAIQRHKSGAILLNRLGLLAISQQKSAAIQLIKHGHWLALKLQKTAKRIGNILKRHQKKLYEQGLNKLKMLSYMQQVQLNYSLMHEVSLAQSKLTIQQDMKFRLKKGQKDQKKLLGCRLFSSVFSNLAKKKQACSVGLINKIKPSNPLAKCQLVRWIRNTANNQIRQFFLAIKQYQNYNLLKARIMVTVFQTIKKKYNQLAIQQLKKSQNNLQYSAKTALHHVNLIAKRQQMSMLMYSFAKMINKANQKVGHINYGACLFNRVFQRIISKRKQQGISKLISVAMFANLQNRLRLTTKFLDAPHIQLKTSKLSFKQSWLSQQIGLSYQIQQQSRHIEPLLNVIALNKPRKHVESSSSLFDSCSSIDQDCSPQPFQSCSPGPLREQVQLGMQTTDFAATHITDGTQTLRMAQKSVDRTRADISQLTNKTTPGRSQNINLFSRKTARGTIPRQRERQQRVILLRPLVHQVVIAPQVIITPTVVIGPPVGVPFFMPPPMGFGGRML